MIIKVEASAVGSVKESKVEEFVDMEESSSVSQNTSANVRKNLKFIERLIRRQQSVEAPKSESYVHIGPKSNSETETDHAKRTEDSRREKTEKRDRRNVQSYGNIVISNASNIHIGNVYHKTGGFNIIQTDGGNIEKINQTSPESSKCKTKANLNKEFGASVSGSILINGKKPARYSSVIIDCTNILQKDEIENKKLEADEQSTNLRDYNFVIDEHGKVFEGKGWENRKPSDSSLRIAFSCGTTTEIPSELSLNACKLVIEAGLKKGLLRRKLNLTAASEKTSNEKTANLFKEQLRKWNVFVETR